MSKHANTRLCLALVLAGLMLPAAAQDAAEAPAATDAPRLGVEEADDGTTRVRVEQDLTIRTRGLPTPASTECQAEIALSYVQKNTFADVDGTLSNATCGASSGQYTLAVSVRDASGATQTLEFEESWQRSDDQDVEFSAQYPIPENVDLLRVRTRRLRCECAEAPVAPAP